jgi:hypothetical protein
VLCLIGTFASTAEAHRIALKDGHVIQFEKYRVAEGQLFYVNSDGREIQVALSSVDLERTRVLSADDSPPLNLPGLMPQDAPVAPNSGQSLGEIAKQVRPKDTKVTAQRTFTDDDVAHGSAISQPEAKALSTTSSDAQYQTAMERLKKLTDDLAGQTPRQLGQLIAGDIQFDGRADWEQKLYEAKEKLVSVVRTSYNLIQRTSDAPTAEERAAAKLAMDKTAYSDVLNAQAPYDSLKIEGAKKAADWKKLHQ